MKSVYLAWKRTTIELVEVLREDGLGVLIRVRHRLAPGETELVKLPSEPASVDKLVGLHNECQLLSRCDFTSIPSLKALEGEGQDLSLRLHDPGGKPVSPTGIGTLAEKVKVALAMADSLQELSLTGLVHRNLQLDAFLWDGERCYLTDLTRAVRSRNQLPDMRPPTSDMKRLGYMSPELTGRLNRAVDYRSDFYSLGVAFYYLFTGILPFTADDPTRLIYQHLAVEPRAPDAVVSSLPPLLSAVILRLLAKDPNHRYQRLAALSQDLSQVLEIVEGKRVAGPVRLAPVAPPQSLDFRHRLYGRDSARRSLLDTVDAALRGKPQLLLISGASGIGKTTLIRETYLPLTGRNAFFVSGKFQQFTRNNPYSAWLKGVDELVQYMLGEPPDALGRWREVLYRCTSRYLPLLVSLVPALKDLLGDQPPPEPLPPAENKQRILEAFVGFFRVFQLTDRPVVVFLDDLQWIDNGSLELLEGLTRHLERIPLLIIGAYRANEVDAVHPLNLALASVRYRSRFDVQTITLESLPSSDIATWLSEALGRAPAEIADLRQEVERRARGNPLFVWQLLQTFYDNGWLYPDRDGNWCWDIDAIRAAPPTGHLIDLMLLRLQRLPPDCRDLLARASCIGASFDLVLLSAVCGSSPAVIQEQLRPALEDEFILPLTDPELVGNQLIVRNMRFVHDRIQEAAQRMLDAEQIPGIHWQVADYLQRAGDSARVLEVASHLNRARSLLTSDEQQLELARINLRAAMAAKQNAAFASALQYLREGMKSLSSAVWRQDYELARSLYRERSELEYLNSNFTLAEEYAEQSIDNLRDDLQKADLYHMLVVQYTLRARYSRAVAMGRQGLVLLGASLPEADLEQAALDQLGDILERIRGDSVSRWCELPAMADVHQRAVIGLLIAMGPPCYRAFPDLWAVIVTRAVQLTLADGLSPQCAYIFPAFGGLLMHYGRGTGQFCAALYDTTDTLMSQFPGSAEASMAHLMMGSSLGHWFRPLGESSQNYLEAYRIGQASGNLQYAVYGFGHDVYARFFRGDPLDELVATIQEYLEYTRARGNLWGIELMAGTLRVCESLCGELPDSAAEYVAAAEADYLEECRYHENFQVLCIYHLMKTCAALQLQDHRAAEQSLEHAERWLDTVSVQGLFPMAIFPALKSLVLLWNGTVPDAEIDRFLVESRRRYARWRQLAPDNFDHWFYWLDAEIARRHGGMEAVVDGYDSALKAAWQQSCWPACSLIAQRAADYWRDRRRSSFSHIYQGQALEALRNLGAGAALIASDGGESSADTDRAFLPVASVIRIAQSFSLYTELKDLVPEVIHQVALQTGAQRVVLLLSHDDDLCLIMDSSVQYRHFYAEPPSLDTRDDLPRAVIRYVARTQQIQRFGLNEIHDSLLLDNDPYLNSPDVERQRADAGTGWAVPLSYLGELIGVLYLEHALPDDALDEQQTPLVEFLAAQAAISVRNIELIDNLSREQKARSEAELRIKLADEELEYRRRLEEELNRLANTDGLTGLANRRQFISVLKRRWEEYREGGSGAFSVMMIDIDHFKGINDRHGHAAGDQVLTELGNTLVSLLRPEDLAARLGGEEFAILLEHQGCTDVRTIADRIRQCIESLAIEVAGAVIRLTVSIGIGHLDRTDSSYDSPLIRADSALYRAKHRGRNLVEEQAREQPPRR